MIAAAMLLSACGGKNTEVPSESTSGAGTSEAVTETDADAAEQTDAQGEEGGGETAETEELPKPFIESETLSKMSEDGEQELVSMLCDEIYLENEGYGELAGNLAQYNHAAIKNAESLLEELSEGAQEDYEFEKENGGTFNAYTSESRITVTRADAKILSYRRDTYEYTGGAHPISGSNGFTFDSQTGEELLLSEVVDDLDGLYETLIEKLEAFSEENGGNVLFEEYADTVKSAVYSTVIEGTDTLAELQWTLGETGMTVYFNPYDVAPYAAGQITIELPYEDHKDLFSEAVLK